MRIWQNTHSLPNHFSCNVRYTKRNVNQSSFSNDTWVQIYGHRGLIQYVSVRRAIDDWFHTTLSQSFHDVCVNDCRTVSHWLGSNLKSALDCILRCALR